MDQVVLLVVHPYGLLNLAPVVYGEQTLIPIRSISVTAGLSMTPLLAVMWYGSRPRLIQSVHSVPPPTPIKETVDLTPFCMSHSKHTPLDLIQVHPSVVISLMSGTSLAILNRHGVSD